MIKKIGIAVLLGVSAIALAACGQQSNNGKDNGSMTNKVQKASDAAAQKVKDAGAATADAMSKAKKSVSDAMNKAGDALKDASQQMTGKKDELIERCRLNWTWTVIKQT